MFVRKYTLESKVIIFMLYTIYLRQCFPYIIQRRCHLNIKPIAKAIEADAGIELLELRDSLIDQEIFKYPSFCSIKLIQGFIDTPVN